MPIVTVNNTLKGKHRPPRYRVFAEDKGVPFTRVFRTLAAAKKLQFKPGITSFTLYVLQ